MKAKYPLKLQAIRSKGRKERLFVHLPVPLAAAIGMEAGELVEWQLVSKDELRLIRVGLDEQNQQNGEI
jgi:hypothetical protein